MATEQEHLEQELINIGLSDEEVTFLCQWANENSMPLKTLLYNIVGGEVHRHAHHMKKEKEGYHYVSGHWRKN